MRGAKNKNRSAEADVSSVSYPKSTAKSSAKTSAAKIEGARRAVVVREEKRRRALGVPVELVIAGLGIGECCPFCGGNGLVGDGERGFACRACGKEGSSVELVKRVRGVAYWAAIAFLFGLDVGDWGVRGGDSSAALVDGGGESGIASDGVSSLADSSSPLVASSPENLDVPGSSCVSSSSSSSSLSSSIIPASKIETPGIPDDSSSSSPSSSSSSPCPRDSRRSKRVSEEEIERLKREVDLAELVRARGVVLKRQGRDLLGRCPFHDDKTPSLVVSPRKNLWHCLGACNVGGSVIDWVMRVEELEFRAAVDWLRERFGDFGGSRGDLEVGAVGEVAELDVDERRLLNQVMDYYHERLKESPEALEYLRRRGLIHRELLGAFRVGFADRTLGLRIPGKACKEGREIRERLARIGLFRADSGREHFAGSLVFPIMEENGVVVGAYGRRIGDKLRAGTSPHLYLPGPHRGIFNTRALVSREIILCESIIDALSFWVHDFRHVTASYGANGFTDEMLRAFVASGVRVVFIAYDADAAGERAAAALGRKLASADISCRRVEFPAGMDANEFVLRSGENARAELGRLLECAVPMDCGKGAAGLFFPLAASDAPVGVDVAAKEENRVAAPCASPSVSCSEEVRSQEKEDAAKEGNRGGNPCGRAQIKGEDVELCCEDRVYRVRGLAKNLSCDTLRITLRVAREQRIHIDTLDMYNARQRAPFIQAAAAELGVKPEAIRCDLAELLLELEKIQERQIANTLNPAKKEVTLSEQERCMALEFLKSPDLVERIRADFARCGLVGEQDNALLLYLAMTSRKLFDPLAVVIQSLSAAGKTALMNFGLAFMPPEDVIKYTAMSAQSLFYMGQNDLVHKILSISEEEGAEKATYPLKIMQSEGELCMASTGKDPKNGRFVTHEYRVDGPSSIIVATTSADMDEEFANRCLLISADEQREQTESIQARQRERETLPGLVQNVERERIRKLHQNAQRLLRPVSVVNPYAKHLTFLANRVRYRRDQPKYLCLIRAIALLHQYQRPLNKRVLENGDVLEYIHVTLDDIALANRLFAHVMGVCLSELPPQTYKLLALIYGMVQKRCSAESIEQSECRFTRREVREFTGWGDTQTKIHMQRLADLEYLHLRHGANGQRNVYQLAYNGEGKDGSRFALGLLDVEVLREKLNYDSNRSGQNSNRSG